jgi:hypothetical protein
MATPESSEFAQQLWARYTRFSTRAPHAQLARRIYRMHGDRLPLLTAVQRRWLPAHTAPFQTQLGLPYVQMPFSPGLQFLSMPTVQRRSDLPPLSPSVAGPGRTGMSAMSNPIRTVQRVAATPPSTPEAPEEGDRRTPRVQSGPYVVAALPLAQRVQRQASPPGGTTPLPATGRQMGVIPPETIGPLPPPGAVQRSAVPPASPGTQRPTDLGVTIFHRHVHFTPGQTMPARVGTAPGQMIYRALILPVQKMDTTPLHPSPPMASLPDVQRQVDASLSVQQMLLAEGGAHTRVSVMRTTVPSTAAARQSVPVDISPPVASVAASPVFGMTILQRHLAMSQSGQQGAVFRGRSMPALQLTLQRSPLAPVAPDSVGHMGLLPAGVLPLARAVDQPAALSDFDRRPSSLSLLSTAHTSLATAHTSLPLVLPFANGQATSVQRQTEQSLASNATTATTNLPPSASVSTPNDTASTTAATNRSQADELAEVVWRKLMRRLVVEGERRGRRTWP